MIGDVHLGDWGLQMGLIIVELKERKPDLVYYDEAIPENIRKRRRLPFPNWRISIRLPAKRVRKTKRSVRLPWSNQPAAGRRRGYRALLAHILDVSVTDLKKNYDNLNVSFELWKGESDAQPYIPDMVQMMKDKALPT